MEIQVADFLNTLVGYFDPQKGMAARDRILSDSLLDESTWSFLLNDLPTLAALLSGVVGVSRLVDTTEFVGMLEAGLPDESTMEIERTLIASLCVKADDQHATVLRLLGELGAWKKVALAVYLMEARRHEARQSRGVSYELHKPMRASFYKIHEAISVSDRALVLAKARDDLRALVTQSTGAEGRALTPVRVTQALDELCDTLEEPAFRRMLAEEVSLADRARILSGMGDLPSSSMLAASPEDAVSAMLGMAEDDAEAGVSEHVHEVRAFSLHTVLACANFMRDRRDWEEVLDVVVDEILGVDRTLRHWIVAALWYEVGCPRRVGTEVADGVFEPIDELAPGVFDDAGIGQGEGLELMAEMLEDGLMPEFDRDEFAAARVRFVAAQTRVHEEATAARREREAAAKKADELET